MEEKLPDLRTMLWDELGKVEDDFKDGELAYLALTSKAEGQIRDRLAYRLYKRLESSDLWVLREWGERGQRVDLAIVDAANAPTLLVEATFWYTFDAQKGVDAKKEGIRANHAKQHLKDVESLLNELKEVHDKFLLIMYVHPSGKLDKKLKYAGAHNSWWGAGESPTKRAESNRIAREHLAPFGQVAPTVIIHAGKAFQVPVEIDAFLVGPLKGDSVTDLNEIVAV